MSKLSGYTSLNASLSLLKPINPVIKNKENNFSGPLFIVGNVSSGTDLLLDLLNQHSDIYLPATESGFLPYWVKHWPSFGDLKNPKLFHRFYHQFHQLYKSLRQERYIKKYHSQHYAMISESDWYLSCKSFDPSGVFEALRRFDGGLNLDSNHIWGDKTPSYIRHLSLIKALFPRAKFIHIVRDVRDVCLSMNNRWGKHIARSAFLWNDNVLRYQNFSLQHPVDCLVVKYEDLISSPGIELDRAYKFIGVFPDSSLFQEKCDYSSKQTMFGNIAIKSDNSKKFVGSISSRQLFQIESLASEGMNAYGYELHHTGASAANLSKMSLLYLWALDGLNLIIRRAKYVGFYKSLISIARRLG
jgi:hypothetical protein